MTGNVWERTCDPSAVAGDGCYCLRYRPAARQSETVDTSTGHLGLRCVAREYERR